MEIKKIKEKGIILVGRKDSVLINSEEKISGARITLFTENGPVANFENGVVRIVAPGEYEVGGVEVEGIKAGETTMYVVSIDRVRVGVIGKVSEELTEKKVDRVGELDVLIFDLAGKISGKEIKNLAKKWGVNYLVPLTEETEGKEMKEFLDLMDEEGDGKQDVLRVERDELPEGMEVVVL